MINNLNQIKELLNFESEDVFYHLQVLKRKKEHPELGSNSYVVKTYYIKSLSHLDFVFPEIKCLCDFHDARAYINLNARSFEKLAFHNLKKVADCIMNKDFKSVRKSYDSVCGSYSADKNKKWIIDVDVKDELIITSISEEIKLLEPNVGQSKVISILETKHGFHIITSPFNCSKLSFIETIQKNNPTILYVK